MKQIVSVLVIVMAPIPVANAQSNDDETALNDLVTGRGSIARILPQRDPFVWSEAVERHTGRASERALGEAFLHLVFEPAAASPDALQAWLSAYAEGLDPDTLVFTSAMYGERLMEIGEYQRARDVFQQLSDAIPQAAPNFANAIGLLDQFGEAGPTRSIGASGTSVATTQDAATLLSIPVEIDGQRVMMIADTGAEFSVMSQSTAHRLGIEFDDRSEQTVGTSTNEALTASFTIIPEIRIGDMVFQDVAATIMPDSALQFSAADSDNLDEDYEISGVLGLPVMVAAGRIAWLENGQRIAFGTAAPEVTDGGAIYWHRQGLGLGVDFGDGNTPVFFDSGARVSQGSLRSLYELAMDPDTLERRTITTGGGGGFAEEEVWVLPELVFGLPGARFTLEDANIYPSEGNPALADGGYAGSDILRSVDVFAVDFRNMAYGVSD